MKIWLAKHWPEVVEVTLVVAVAMIAPTWLPARIAALISAITGFVVGWSWTLV